MRSLIYLLGFGVGLFGAVGTAQACGLYGLDHHLENGTFEWAPFEPSTKEGENAAGRIFSPKSSTMDPALMKPQISDDPTPQQTQFKATSRPVFGQNTRSISKRARLKVQYKKRALNSDQQVQPLVHDK